MASFLRVVRQARWLKFPDLAWLPQNEIQADALLDLQTRENKLSVFKVENDEDTSRVVIALAANRETLSNLDYAIVEDRALESTGIIIDQQAGETPDEAVNALHYDLTSLTVDRLSRLAEIVSVAQHKRVPRKEIETGLRQAVGSGILNRDRIKPRLLSKIG